MVDGVVWYMRDDKVNRLDRELRVCDCTLVVVSFIPWGIIMERRLFKALRLCVLASLFIELELELCFFDWISKS